MSADRPGTPAPQDHDTFDELAVGWAMHALEPEDEAFFAVHLAGCSRCAATVAETVEVMAAMAADLPPAEPSEDLRRRLREAVESTEQVPRAAEPTPARGVRTPESATSPAGPRPALSHGGPGRGRARTSEPAWRRLGPRALVAAAVATIVGLGLWNVVLADSRADLQATAAEQAEIVSALLKPGQATIAPLSDDRHSVVTVVARDGQLQVVTHGLEVNDADDTVYVVWGMRDGDPVPLGTFDVVEPEMDLRTVGSGKTGLDDYSAYGVSIEPGRSAPREPSTIVATGQVNS